MIAQQSDHWCVQPDVLGSIPNLVALSEFSHSSIPISELLSSNWYVGNGLIYTHTITPVKTTCHAASYSVISPATDSRSDCATLQCDCVGNFDHRGLEEGEITARHKARFFIELVDKSEQLSLRLLSG